jgi:hypothetical protein
VHELSCHGQEPSDGAWPDEVCKRRAAAFPVRLMACPYARIEQGLEPRLAETQNGGKRLMRGDIHSIFRSKKQVSRVVRAS